jgi:hypothetical protein
VPRDPSFNVDAAAVVAKIRQLGRCIVYALTWHSHCEKL